MGTSLGWSIGERSSGLARIDREALEISSSDEEATNVVEIFPRVLEYSDCLADACWLFSTVGLVLISEKGELQLSWLDHQGDFTRNGACGFLFLPMNRIHGRTIRVSFYLPAKMISKKCIIVLCHVDTINCRFHISAPTFSCSCCRVFQLSLKGLSICKRISKNSISSIVGVYRILTKLPFSYDMPWDINLLATMNKTATTQAYMIFLLRWLHADMLNESSSGSTIFHCCLIFFQHLMRFSV